MKFNPKIRYEYPISRPAAGGFAAFWAAMLVADFVAPPGGHTVTIVFAVIDTLFLLHYGRQFLFHRALTERRDRAEAARQQSRQGSLNLDKEV